MRFCGACKVAHDVWAPCDQTLIVKGKTIRLTRLDAEGRVVEGLSEIVAGVRDFNIISEFPETKEVYVWDEERDGVVVWPTELKRITMDITLIEPNPELIRLLTGGLLPHPWWWRFLPRLIQHRLKARRLRRGYGG